MTRGDLAQRLRENFSEAPRPAPDLIVTHQCEECSRIRDDFSPFDWSSVPGDIFEYHWDAFSLFTPQAFHYYLPGYMLHVLNRPNSEVAEWMLPKLLALGRPDDFWAQRLSLFSASEKAVIREFLHFVYETSAFVRLRADCYDALVCWGERPDPAVEGSLR